MPATNSKAFYDSPIASATLHVPKASIDSYKATKPWSGFGKIVGLSNRLLRRLYTFAESDATPATIGYNLLYGTVATTQISTDPTYSYYVLSKVDGIVGMYLAKLTGKHLPRND